MAGLLARGLVPSYLSHITGHGLLKLMRAPKPLTYRVSRLPPVPEVLSFLVEQSGMSPSAAYATFNMGCGFTLYCSPSSTAGVVELAGELGFDALVAGAVEEGPRQVILEPVGVRYGAEELDLGGVPDAAGA
jgi:phosphoribosylformylglycinamidine cyclo-ligase